MKFYISFCMIMVLVSLNAQELIYKNEVYTVTGSSVVETVGNRKVVTSIDEGSNLMTSDYFGERRERIIKEYEGYPRVETKLPIVDLLYKMAIEEINLNIDKKGFFVAGAKWNSAWTRDMSYAIYLSLGFLFNETSEKSLETRVYKEKILQDTGTGGSYPISTDRMTWAMAAYETALYKNDLEYYKNIYNVIKNSMLQDMDTVFDSKTHLFKGEQSFLDWREQTYPRWMTPRDIGDSFALGTNMNHLIALGVLEKLSVIVGDRDYTGHWKELYQKVKHSIDTWFWSETQGYLSAYVINGIYPYRYQGYETLGTSLAIIEGLLDSDRSFQSLNVLESTPYGMSVVAPQLKDIPPYHNNGIWPFVQSYRGLAAARTGDNDTALEEFAAVIRGGSVFLSFKENMVASTGSSVGTEINSDRQLWSVAGYLSFIFRVVAGIDQTVEGLEFSPMIFRFMKNGITIRDFKYRGGIFDIIIRGQGSEIAEFRVDSEEKFGDDRIIGESYYDGRHTIEIFMKDRRSGSEKAVVTKAKWDTLEEIGAVNDLQLIDGVLTWRSNVSGPFEIMSNGKVIAETELMKYKLEEVTAGEQYRVIVKGREFVPQLVSNPVIVESYDNTILYDLEKALVKGGSKTDKIRGTKMKVDSTDASITSELKSQVFNGRSYIERWGNEKGDSITVRLNIKESGFYKIDYRYQRGGPVNTGEACAIRELYLDGEFVKVLYMPQTGSWLKWFFSTNAVVHLDKGRYKLTLKSGGKSFSQKERLNPINIDMLRVVRF